MSEGPVKYVGPGDAEVVLFNADAAGVAPSNDLRITVRHNPYGEDDVVVVTQRVGNQDVNTTLFPGDTMSLGGDSEIVHEVDL